MSRSFSHRKHAPPPPLKHGIRGWWAKKAEKLQNIFRGEWRQLLYFQFLVPTSWPGIVALTDCSVCGVSALHACAVFMRPALRSARVFLLVILWASRRPLNKIQICLNWQGFVSLVCKLMVLIFYLTHICFSMYQNFININSFNPDTKSLK